MLRRFHLPRLVEMPGVLPGLRYLYWAVVRGYESELCFRCGRPYFESLGETYWYADDALWQEVEGGPGGLRCPACFTRDARKQGILVYWRPVVESRRP